jgi:DNA-binding Lrp family transcriptional regulator
MPNPALDDTDHALIRFLRRDARTPTAELARRVGVSRTTVQSRLERLERDGVIKGYTIQTGDSYDPGVIRATVLIQVEPRATAAIVTALGKMREVEGLFTTAGRFDMAIQLAASGTPALDTALDRIGEMEGVRGMESLIHLTAKIDRRR